MNVSGLVQQGLRFFKFYFRPKDDGEIKQPVRLLPVLETTDPSSGHVGAGGPGAGGQQEQTKRQDVPAVESGQRGETFIYI